MAETITYRQETKRLANMDLKRIDPPRAGEHLEIRDTACDGLRLRVTSKGHRSWCVVYRVAGEGPVGKRGRPGKGKTRRYTLEEPFKSYRDARKLALEVLEAAANGDDYAEERKQHALGHSSRSVKALIERFIVEYARPETKKSGNREDLARNWLEKPEVKPWHDRELADITRADIHSLLNKVTANRGQAASIEMRKHLSKLFHWALDQQFITTNPITRLDRVEVYEVRERVLSMDELRRIWDACGNEKEDLGYPFGPMYRMLILTGARRAEIGEMEKSERRKITLDGETVPAVVIPPSKHKSRRGHTMYLSPPAAAILDSLPDLGGKFLFSSTEGKTPVSGYSKGKARLDRILKERAEKEAAKRGEEPPEPMEHWTVHDIRRTVATNLAEMGIPGDHIERVLGHSMEKLQRTYIKHDYAQEMRDAMLVWGELWT
ncbi:MAG: tyrosine-type recombinase/integrase [Porphyrobacter sp.]|nr:tyrosine-type recombinase/integrase [Porphyrobacter sp.]